MKQLPPFPTADLNRWARSMYDYLSTQSPVKGTTDPTPLLLPQPMANQLPRATVDGLVLFDPSTQQVQVSVGGVFVPLALDADVTTIGGRVTTLETQRDAVWQSAARTPVPTAGAFTTASANIRWVVYGKRLFLNGSVTITTNGTAAGAVNVPLPTGLSVVGTQIVVGRENAAVGKMLQGVVTGSNIFLFNYDNTYPGGDGYSLLFTGVLELS